MKKNKVAALIQARLGSTRLPLKSLLCLKELPIIDWVVSRVRKTRKIDEVIVALPDTSLDDILYKHLEKRGMRCHNGSETDVLARMNEAAKISGADTVVRICADNPLIDPESLDDLIDFYRNNNCDYAYNHVPKSNLWPDGLGAEILSSALLSHIEKKAKQPLQREHCLNYIWDNATNFDIRTFNPEDKNLQRPDIKLDIDSPADYQRICALNPDPDMSRLDIINAWDKALEKS